MLIMLQAIIGRYKEKYYRDHLSELEWFAQQATLKSAIECAALAKRRDGKKYSHQWRIPESALQRARVELLDRESTICQCRTFHELFEIVEEAASKIKWLGELYSYDTAVRIGSRLKLNPDRVYLHRGVREGARRLGFNGKARWIARNELPEPLRSLEAAEVEDILCIYKDELNGTYLKIKFRAI